jgi:L-methionine (R)-S-oxide reductase
MRRSTHVFATSIDSNQKKPALYAELASALRSLIEGEADWIANLANASSLLYHSLPDLNWAGFYLLKQGELVVGPFQGKPACVRIAIGKGVCGTAAQERKTVIVTDVHAFAGHIACDSASNSEIVVPVMGGGELLGVLDLDSPKLKRFDEEDRDGLERLVAILIGNRSSGSRFPTGRSTRSR